jgi:hypothetical protein
MDDPNAIDQFLEGRFPPEPNDPLRQALLMQTTRLLRRRHRLKQASLVAAMIACYVAGLATMHFGAPAPAPVLVQDDGQSDSPVKTSSPALPQEKRELVQAEPPLEEDPEAPAFIFERVAAFASADKRALLFRLAGDRYLENDHDEESALRCYARALDSGTEHDRAISPSDNWLLIALKKARQEEKSHAKTNG